MNIKAVSLAAGNPDASSQAANLEGFGKHRAVELAGLDNVEHVVGVLEEDLGHSLAHVQPAREWVPGHSGLPSLPSRGTAPASQGGRCALRAFFARVSTGNPFTWLGMQT